MPEEKLVVREKPVAEINDVESEDLANKNRKLVSHIRDLELTQDNYQRQIKTLFMQLHMEREKSRFTLHGSTFGTENNRPKLFRDRDVQQAVTKINSLIKEYFAMEKLTYCEFSHKKLLQTEGMDGACSALALYRSYLNMKSTKIPKRGKCPRIEVHNKQYSSHGLLTTLIWTALRDWIMQSDVFSDFIQMSPFWEHVIASIQSHNGSESVRKLYLSSWHALTRSDQTQLQDWLSPRIEEYASRLSSLARTFEQICNDDDEPDTVDENKRVFEWSQVISAAFVLKKQLPFMEVNVECYLPLPETTFDAQSMENDVFLPHSVDASKRKVALCVSPAFILHASGTGDPDDDSSVLGPECIHQVVDVKKATRQQGEISCKAIVILEELAIS